MIVTGTKAPKSNADNTDVEKYSCFKPWFPFGSQYVNGWFYQNQNLVLGSYSMGTFSLQSLYAEHLMMRNRWSQSNCGFDLATYRGTKLYFMPHPEYDYIVFIDAEYRDFKTWAKQCMHPAVLITHPQTRIIRSLKNAGPRRKLPKMFVPPPSTMNTGWQWMQEIATAGMFAWFMCWIDFTAPWIGNVEDPNTVKWWSTGSAVSKPDWFKNAIEMQGKNMDEAMKAFFDISNNRKVSNGNKFDMIGYGPFIFKGVYARGDPGRIDYPQVCWFYKSYWQWGGSTTGLKDVCDPKTENSADFYRGKTKGSASLDFENWSQSTGGR